MSGTARIRALNDALESQNNIIAGYGAREKQDKDTKVELYNILSRVSDALNESPSGVEVLPFPPMRSEELARMKPHEMTEAIKKWCSVAANALKDTRKELGELYAELGMASIDTNLEQFHKLRAQANQAGIAASFRGSNATETLPVRPKTPELALASPSAVGVGPVSVPSPPDSTNGARPRPEATKKQTSSKTTTLDTLLGAAPRSATSASKKK